MIMQLRVLKGTARKKRMEKILSELNKERSAIRFLSAVKSIAWVFPYAVLLAMLTLLVCLFRLLVLLASAVQ